MDISLEDESPTRVSLFKGQDPSKWKAGLPSYNLVNFGEVYSGIELSLATAGGSIEKVFSISPGADPEDILIRIDGADELGTKEDGRLVVQIGGKVIEFTKPVAYQDIAGKRNYIEVAYKVQGNEYGFDIGDYNSCEPLIIDPLLASTYFGGSGAEGNAAGQEIFGDLDMTIGGDSNIYVTGLTESADFPTTTGAYEEDYVGNLDLFILKFDADLSTLLAATYLGGSGNERFYFVRTIAIDYSGYIYVSGTTQSSDFPTSPDAYDRLISGTADVFVSKLSADLTTLVASTYLGGSSTEARASIALDENGNVFVAGTTYSNNFPCSDGAFDQYYAGTCDFFVSKFDANLSTLLASTYLGEIYREDYPSILIDNSGNVVVSGATGSEDYPVTPNAYDTSFNGPFTHGFWDLDVCVSKLDNSLSTMLASTFIGGDDYEGGLQLTRDSNGNIFVAGHTWDANYPVTDGVLDQEFSGDEYFISKLDGDLTSLLASTFITPEDAGLGYIWHLITDNNGYVCHTGITSADDLPTTYNAYDNSFNGGDRDCYLTKIDNNLTEIVYSTYFGSSGEEGGSSVAINASGEAYVLGFTNSSSDFPITPGAYDADYNGGPSDAFIAKFTFDQFTEITEGPHVTDAKRSSGVCWVDYNEDNYLDLYVTNARYPETENNSLYQNNGGGTFSQMEGLEIVNDDNFSTCAGWADYDNDGDLDLFVAAHRTHPSIFYTNDGAGNFSVNTATPLDKDTVGSTTTSWIDYDTDGDLDLFVGNSTGPMSESYPPYRNFLYRNDDGTFTEITAGDIVTHEKHTYGASWCDYDSDGDPDLVAPNNVDEYTDLYRNDGDGEFTFVSSSVICQSIVNGGGSSWSDYDNDGDMDLFIGGFSPGPSYLFQNNGDGTFYEVPGHGLDIYMGRASAGVWADYDNDGDEDIYIWFNNYTDISLSGGYLFENLADGTFSKITEGTVAGDTCTVTAAVWGDYDRDGDLDLYLANYDPENDSNISHLKNEFFQNNGNSNNWITIKFAGTMSNHSAIGTKVRLKATINGAPVWQMRELMSQTGLGTQPPLEVHFGLGDAVMIDSVKVEWSGDRITDILTDFNVNQFLTITETICGNMNLDQGLNMLDILDLIAYLYKGGAEPDPIYAANVNNDSGVDMLDILGLISYLYKGGPEPVCP
jgi:hypothetical protein